MVAKRFEDLIVWQLAHELEEEVFAFTANSPASRDFKFCDQIRDAIRSVKRNVAEGFGKYYPKEFSRFLRIAAGSLHETKNHLRDGSDRNYLTPEKFEQLTRLCLRAIKANNKLIAYLARCDPPDPYADPTGLKP